MEQKQTEDDVLSILSFDSEETISDFTDMNEVTTNTITNEYINLESHETLMDSFINIQSQESNQESIQQSSQESSQDQIQESIQKPIQESSQKQSQKSIQESSQQSIQKHIQYDVFQDINQYESDNESELSNKNISKINELLQFILNTLHSKKSKEKVLQNICNDTYSSKTNPSKVINRPSKVINRPTTRSMTRVNETNQSKQIKGQDIPTFTMKLRSRK